MRARPALLAALLMSLLVMPSPARAAVNAFVFHRFGESRYPSTNVDLEIFSRQLEQLRDGGYRVLTLGEVVERLERGAELPERCAVLSVDDAYRSFIEGAMPLLRRFGFRATLFVSTDSVGQGDSLGWDELRRLQAEGIEIGNHSAGHDYLLERRRGEDGRAWRQRVTADIARAQATLTRELGVAPRLFAYPYGEYSAELQEIVREQGFAGAAAQHSGVVWAGSDRFALPRFPMGGRFATNAEFRAKLRYQALPVTVLQGADGVVAAAMERPELLVEIAASGADLSRLEGFVDGERSLEVRAVPGEPGRYRLRARQPLAGRRSKYTLTAPGRTPGEWFWFTQPWVRPGRR